MRNTLCLSHQTDCDSEDKYHVNDYTLRHSDTDTHNYYNNRILKRSTIKRVLAEFIFFIELKNIDLVELRLRSFWRSYSNYLKENNQKRVLKFLVPLNSILKIQVLLKSHLSKTRLRNHLNGLKVKSKIFS